MKKSPRQNRKPFSCSRVMRSVMWSMALLATLFGQTMESPRAQEKVYRLGFLSGPIPSGLETSIPSHLSLAGYPFGTIVTVERNAGGTAAGLRELADELIAQEVDLLVTDDAESARAAAQSTQEVPIVSLLRVDPVKLGVANDIGAPGGNVTGVLMFDQHHVVKKFEILNEFVPGLSRVGVIYNPGTLHGREIWGEAQAVAVARNIRVEPIPFTIRGDIDKVLNSALAASCQALLVTDDSATWGNKSEIYDFALKHRIVVLYPGEYWIRRGEGLAAYGPDSLEARQSAAAVIDKILKGGRPAEIPFSRASRFELQVSRSSAEKIGVKIPSIVLRITPKLID